MISAPIACAKSSNLEDFLSGRARRRRLLAGDRQRRDYFALDVVGQGRGGAFHNRHYAHGTAVIIMFIFILRGNMSTMVISGEGAMTMVISSGDIMLITPCGTYHSVIR
jgi:uncharacterized protein YjlB